MLAIIIIKVIKNVLVDSMRDNFRIIVNMVMGSSLFLGMFILVNLLIISLRTLMAYLCGKMGICIWVVLLMV